MHFLYGSNLLRKKVRRKSVPRAISEIEPGMRDFNVHQFFIWADTFTADREYVLEFCKYILKKKLNIGWTCSSRVDTVDEILLDTMKRAGCWMISFGVESGSQAILDKSSKNTTVDQCRNAVRMAKEAGMKTAAHFVLGLPGETPRTVEKTIELALELDPEIAQFYCAVPFPGSPLYELAEEQGWIANTNFEELRQDNASMTMPGLPPSLLNHYRKSGFQRFYLKRNRLIRLANS